MLGRRVLRHSGRRHKRRCRAHIHDSATAVELGFLAGHEGRHGAGHMKCAHDIDLKETAEFISISVADFRGVLDTYLHQ